MNTQHSSPKLPRPTDAQTSSRYPQAVRAGASDGAAAVSAGKQTGAALLPEAHPTPTEKRRGKGAGEEREQKPKHCWLLQAFQELKHERQRPGRSSIADCLVFDLVVSIISGSLEEVGDGRRRRPVSSAGLR